MPLKYRTHFTAKDGTEATIAGDEPAVKSIQGIFKKVGIRWDEDVQTYDCGFYSAAREEAGDSTSADMLAALKGIQAYAEEMVADYCADIQEGGQPDRNYVGCWNAVLAAIAKAEGRGDAA